MEPLLAAGAGLLGLAAVALVARREARAARAARGPILDACAGLFDEARLTKGGDGFPRLDGRIAGRRVTLCLIVDSLTIRRLPQLWLSLTMVEDLPIGPGFAALARPAGSEFYALAHDFAERLDPPAGFPAEVLVRGGGRRAAGALAAAAPAVAALLADPRVKEVAATRRGLRVIRQLAEGRRGEHLLLRQCAFANVSVAPAMLIGLFDGLTAVRDALAAPAPAAHRSERLP